MPSLKKITALASLKEDRAATLEEAWQTVVLLYKPSTPVLSKAELAKALMDYRREGWVSQHKFSLTEPGLRELEKEILLLDEPWDIEKIFALMQIAFFHLSGRVRLSEEVIEFINQKMQLAPGVVEKLPEKAALFD